MHRACEYCETVQSNVNTLPGPLAAADQLQALRGLLNNPALAQILQAQSNRGGFGRKRRQANGLLNPSEEDKEEFLEDFMDFKHSMETKIGNLSYVMTLSSSRSSLTDAATATTSPAASPRRP